MDYMQFVDYHRSSNADITIGCIAYDETRASDFGLMKVGMRLFGLYSPALSTACSFNTTQWARGLNAICAAIRHHHPSLLRLYAWHEVFAQVTSSGCAVASLYSLHFCRLMRTAAC
jgi:hypothetical protein